ncbi:hypothetical protein [Catenuloplanes indicus]|uniref:Uncharacterized protein n=1 Tax=Catenuloplanes indicus TaxID=137267 RepID=A0AAE3VWZ7_9ACTN|nr:hypothetical protein [Catenuloplanes indicus]MDQ0365142.1 hypothetical protein [Catenuloplanes indicus]
MEAGDRIIITAAVDQRLDARAFIIRDVDLPAAGVLVLDPAATPIAAPQLVTVHGIVRRFAYGAHAPGYGLRDPDAYRAFETAKVLRAEHIEVHD